MKRPVRSTAGVTLFEIMIALTIMSLIMVALYQTLDASLKTRDQLDLEARAARVGPELLDVIEADLRQAWVGNIAEDAVFLADDMALRGEQADALQFITTVDSTITQNIDGYEVSSDVSEVGYRCRINAEYDDVMELWRRQSYHVDEEPLKGGTYDLLYDRVVSFQLRYLPSMERTEEYVDTWDAAERKRLPVAVLVDLILEVGPRARGDTGGFGAITRHHRRFIPLARNSGVVMRIHPTIPTFEGVGGEGGAAAGNNGDDGDGEGDGDQGDGGDGDGGPPGNGGGGNPFDDIFGGSGGSGGGGGGGGIPGDIFGGGGG